MALRHLLASPEEAVMTTREESATTTPVVFIHGLWIHSASWKPWIDRFAEAGYAPVAPGWPGDSATVELTRANADQVADRGIAEITQHYADLIAGLPSKPVVIGHSFGGLIAQKLLADGQAAAAIAIDPGQIKGVKGVALAQVRTGLPVLRKPGNKKRAVSLTKKQFAYSFGNTLATKESDALFDWWSIPGPGRVLFEGTSANRDDASPAAVDTTRSDRGPLLFIAGGKDHTTPQKVVVGAHALYRNSDAVTDLEVFPDRGHSLVFDHGWQDVADRALSWLEQQNI